MGIEAWGILISAVTGLLTALFTGWGAFLVWRQQQDRLTLEWQQEYSATSSEITIRARLRNDTKSTVSVSRLRVSGPVLMVQSSNEPKHESWPANACYIRCEPKPGSDAPCSFFVLPDWASLQATTSGWFSRKRTQFARWVATSSSGSRFVHHGASLHFHMIIDSKSNSRFRKTITQTIWISPEVIANKIAMQNKTVVGST